MMKAITLFIVMAIFLSGCVVNTNIAAATSDPMQQKNTNPPTATEFHTEENSESGMQELTVYYIDNEFHSSVYLVSVGCFQTTPCVINSELIFRMSFPVSGLSWSPDGQYLVFESFEQGQSDIFIFSAKDQGIKNITNTLDLKESSPHWSPDGKKIAYLAQGQMIPSVVFTAFPDGTNNEQILTEVLEPIEFVWSNQGMMAYSAVVSIHDPEYQIRILNPDGSMNWQVPIVEKQVSSGALQPAFSPDGNWLLFSWHGLTKSRIYVADLQKRTYQELFPNEKSCHESDPAWSPESDWLAFISNCDSRKDSQYDIYIVNLDHKKKINLPTMIDGNPSDVVWKSSQ